MQSLFVVLFFPRTLGQMVWVEADLQRSEVPLDPVARVAEW